MSEYQIIQHRRSSRVAGNRPVAAGPLGRFTSAGRSGTPAGVTSIERRVDEQPERPVAAQHRTPDGKQD